MQEHELCIIPLGERAVASDPSYSVGTWCGEYDIPVKAGKYTLRYVRGKYNDWGERTARLSAHLQNEEVEEWSLYELLGVDSGRMSIWDAEHYESEAEENGRGVWAHGERERMYAMTVREINENWPENRFTEHGGWTSAGFGDGTYPCYIGKNADGETVAISIVFIFREEDEEAAANEEGFMNCDNPLLLRYAGAPASVWD